jgi:hypothetical protein
MTERYTKIVSDQIPMCRGQKVIAAMLLALHEKATFNLEKNGIDRTQLDSAILKLEDKTAEATVPVCAHICNHVVGSCVFVEGVTVDNPDYQVAQLPHKIK